MNKWEKVYYKEKFDEVKEQMQQDRKSQQEINRNMGEMMSQVGLLLEENKDLLELIRAEIGETKCCLEEKADAVSRQLQEKERKLSKIEKQGVKMKRILETEYKESQEGFSNVLSLLKMVLMNELLDDTEEALLKMEEAKNRKERGGAGKNCQNEKHTRKS